MDREKYKEVCDLKDKIDDFKYIKKFINECPMILDFVDKGSGKALLLPKYKKLLSEILDRHQTEILNELDQKLDNLDKQIEHL